MLTKLKCSCKAYYSQKSKPATAVAAVVPHPSKQMRKYRKIENRDREASEKGGSSCRRRRHDKNEDELSNSSKSR